MIVFNSLFALAVGVALSHALVSPYPFKGSFIYDDSHWLESPSCCKTQLEAEVLDECEPGIYYRLRICPSPCCGDANPGLTTRVT